MIINSCGREGKNLSKKLLAIIFAAVMFISAVIPSAAAATDTYTRADVKGNDTGFPAKCILQKKR